MYEAATRRVVQDRVPVLGICVGMQMMASSSEEGRAAGLGWVKGVVRKFDTTKFAQRTHLPHMGWNDVHPTKSSHLFEGWKGMRAFISCILITSNVRPRGHARQCRVRLSVRVCGEPRECLRRSVSPREEP